MKAALAVVVCLLAVAVAPQAGARSTCTPGVHTTGGLTTRTFCGPAKATVHYGARVFHFNEGMCTRASGMFTINVGTVVLGITSKPKPEYFGITVGMTGKKATKDGTYRMGAISFNHGGKGYLVRANTSTVTLAGGLTRGTFAGVGFTGAPRVTGTFSCR